MIYVNGYVAGIKVEYVGFFHLYRCKRTFYVVYLQDNTVLSYHNSITI